MRPASSKGTSGGFRLGRFEVLNWGTFGARVWAIEPGGENSLLTGDIGSGKSTLVDALTTLLVPPRKVSYNRAAGAEARERTTYSYVRGEFRSISNAVTGGAQTQTLRDESAYSVILGVFSDARAGRDVTLAQVFWIKPGERTASRFYALASASLSIKAEFSSFGTEIAALRKRLRTDNRVRLFDSFEEYGAALRRELGIPHPQALDLFNQTVSMKSVGNLTEFVRHHMLEPDDIEIRIRSLLENFENLNRAHEAVLQARNQIELLRPLVEDGDRLLEVEAKREELRRARDLLAAWFLSHRARLLEARIEDLNFDIVRSQQQLEARTAKVAQLSNERSSIQLSIERQGGGRIRELETDIARKEEDCRRQRVHEETYRKLCTGLEIRPGTTLESYLCSLRVIESRKLELEAKRSELDIQIVEKAVEVKKGMERDKALREEIQSLESRTSSIPGDSIRIRSALAQALHVDVEDLPFAGEHLRVRPDEAAWEGAIERLLRGFALSLLVCEELYARVTLYVDRTHLRGRLIFLRVQESAARSTVRLPGAESVARKLEVKVDSAFYTFLERELSEQFDHACCDEMDEFRRLPKAITRNGLIKSRGHRHDKDDREIIGNRGSYVLGWDNRAKVRALRQEQSEVQRRVLVLNGERDALDKERSAAQQGISAADRLLELREFAVIDWRGTVAAIQKMEEEKRAIERSDDTLRTLREQLVRLNEEYSAAESERQKVAAYSAVQEEKVGEAREQLLETRHGIEHASAGDLDAHSGLLEEWKQRVLGADSLQLRLLESQQQRIRAEMQAKLDAETKATERLRERIVEQMQRYKARYASETVELDASTAALPEYKQRLHILLEDDLPRFEANFKELLNKKTINGMASFQAHLQRRRHEIEDRIRTINSSLHGIEYDRTQGTYIELVSMPSPDVDVREFQSELRACISGGDDTSEMYTEQKFLQVKDLLERLRGREGQTDLDARWREKVTDVRNWFEFGARERWRSDGTEYQFYRDSSGKSGGQKEKLAYTILAAALAYQFGLTSTQPRSRHFRFVVIDEAFGRGSDESTRYGLELFRSLDLQLLIVTPLQKIAVIEDYIAAVHFVHNEGGAESMVQNLTIEEYRERRQQFLATASS